MSAGKKKRVILIAAAAALVLAGSLVFLVLAQSGVRYDYTHLKPEEKWEEGSAFRPEGESAVAGFAKAADNGTLELLVEEKTGQIAVYDKRSGKVWYSCPEGTNEDSLANKTEKAKMASQVSVVYYDKLYRENSFYSFPDSVEKGQFELFSVRDGVRIVYTMGKKPGESGGAQIPRYILAERLEETILSKLEEKDQKYITNRYIESKAKPGFLEISAKNLTSEVIVKKLSELLAKAGYTAEDLAYDNEQSGYESEAKEPYVILPVDFVLTEDRLSVTVPVGRVEAEKSIWIKSIDLLNYFGAGSEREDGYLFVPSGSGALIYFNNGKTGEAAYSQNVYGTDPVLMALTQMQSQQTVRLPVFGLKSGDAAYVAAIEEGAALSNISADISGRKNSYNNVYASFQLRSTDEQGVNSIDGGNTAMKLVEKDSYQGMIRMEYCFLEEERADYSGMAQRYRNLLIERGELGDTVQTEGTKKQAPFYLDLLGVIQKPEYFAGVPYQALVPMTTLEQSGKILDALGAAGIENVRLRYMGWFNRGVNHDSPEKLSLDSKVGSKKEWAALTKRLERQGGALFPDAAFQYIPFNSKNFSEAKQASRLISGYSVSVAPYNVATLRMNSKSSNGVFYMVSPNSLPALVDSFAGKFEKLPMKNLALRDLGDILGSDKAKKRYVDRESAALIVKEQLDKLSEQSSRLMINGGNLYSLAYADEIIGVPTSEDRFYLTDAEVPFYQLVVSGSAGYAGTSFNLSDIYNKQKMILSMMEHGNAPHFTWTYEDTEKFSMTQFENYYSTNYRNWLEDAADFQKAYEELYLAAGSGRMTGHEILSGQVRKVTYENGTQVYINYSQAEQSADGLILPAESYQIRKAGEAQ